MVNMVEKITDFKSSGVVLIKLPSEKDQGADEQESLQHCLCTALLPYTLHPSPPHYWTVNNPFVYADGTKIVPDFRQHACIFISIPLHKI